jgi:hypothetical protein
MGVKAERIMAILCINENGEYNGMSIIMASMAQLVMKAA